MRSLAVILFAGWLVAGAPLARAAEPAAEGTISKLYTAGAPYGAGELATPTPAVVVGNIIKSFLTLVGVVFLVLIIYAGFQWMTAGGNEEKVKSAKKLLTNAVIGMVLIFLAYVITNFVVARLSMATAL